MTALALNTDVGEGFGVWGPADEGELLDQVTAANVACGFHAGDPDILRRTCEASTARGVAIGAQVSYRDLAGFGRRFIDVPPATLVNELLYQMGALEVFARLAGGRVGYVKAHGALYNAAARHTGHAAAIVEAVALYDRTLPLLCQPRTAVWERALEAGVRPLAEGFIDRGYTDEGLLVPRSAPGALITDPAEAAERALRMAESGTVVSVSGGVVRIAPDGGELAALCVHSDTPGAVGLAAAVREALASEGVAVGPPGAAADRVGVRP
ncbi:LamB/YcsF family protein [Streptomyces rhizosphaericus]|uniref:LamB/YcsF family protein n=1 Tax=Streptomyces rhizosphaericus TaxID=114699 RepID=A0A6G4ABK7_9ACTN|nr:5-oxoprolinase subunit PxpA [Streptomyces rhizosphaericus]NEW70610.1 LamB/YcsF family protein [Streptomyces rhizosphaericus]